MRYQNGLNDYDRFTMLSRWGYSFDTIRTQITKQYRGHVRSVCPVSGRTSTDVPLLLRKTGCIISTWAFFSLSHTGKACTRFESVDKRSSSSPTGTGWVNAALYIRWCYHPGRVKKKYRPVRSVDVRRYVLVAGFRCAEQQWMSDWISYGFSGLFFRWNKSTGSFLVAVSGSRFSAHPGRPPLPGAYETPTNGAANDNRTDNRNKRPPVRGGGEEISGASPSAAIECGNSKRRVPPIQTDVGANIITTKSPTTPKRQTLPVGPRRFSARTETF